MAGDDVSKVAVNNDDDDIVVEAEAGGRAEPFHRKLMREARKEDSRASSAAKLAAKIRQERKEAERPENVLQGPQKGKNLRSTPNNKGHWGDVIDLSRLQPSTVASILKRNVIYDNGDVVVINKPYGLAVHGGPKVTNNISSLLPTLAYLLRGQQTVAMEMPNLHLIHRLDKETTGVMMLARSEVTARQLHQQFFQRQIQKKYWVVCIGVPDPHEGLIDIPLIDKEVAGKNRIIVSPEIGDMYSDIMGGPKRQRRSHTALTNFRVISYGNGAALVELLPETGVKHQLRAHMSQGLGCPILGDHKYSHHDRLAPQVLPGSMLRLFGIAQPKVRGMPMHLVAKQLRIPDFQDGRALTISVKLPRYFVKTLQKLKLRIP